MKINNYINIRTLSALFFVALLSTVFISQQNNNVALSPYVGNPIHAGTGNKYQVVNDYSSSTGGIFSRYYNSLDAQDINLGVGWRHTYSRSLDVSSSTTISAKRDDGKTYTFTNDGAGNWSTDPDVPVTLLPTATGWEYSKGNDLIEAYDPKGKLETISDKNGVKIH